MGKETSVQVPDYEIAVIKELGLTNTEWLRFRLVGEFPERANAFLEARWHEQTKYLYEPQPPRLKRPKLPDIDLSTFETGSQTVTAYIDTVLSAEQPTSQELAGVVKNLADFREEYGIFLPEEIRRLTEYEQLRQKADGWITTFQIYVDKNPPKSKRDQALAIACLHGFERTVHRPMDYRERALDMVSAAVYKDADFELVAELLLLDEDSRLAVITRGTLETYYKTRREGRVPAEGDLPMLSILIYPFAVYAAGFNKYGKAFDSGGPQSYLIDLFARDIKRIGNDILTAEQKAQITAGADLYLKTAMEALERMPTGIATHEDLRGGLRILTALYSVGIGQTSLPLDKVYSFLRVMYAKKIIQPYPGEDSASVHQDIVEFIKLAGVLGLDMAIIDGRK